jgi:hypothetical protein
MGLVKSDNYLDKHRYLLKPQVKSIMQVYVRQYWTHYSLYAKDNFGYLKSYQSLELVLSA